MIDVLSVSKSFGERAVLRRLDLRVDAGERLVLIGANGAGKTTLLRILATLTRPDEGQVRIQGIDLARDDREARRRIGFVSHQPLVYGDLSVKENLEFYGRMYDVADVYDRITNVLSQVGLASSGADQVRTFSRGMRQRLSLARALLHRPPVLLLDEPYAGLDRQAARRLTAILNDVSAEGSTTVVTTHDLERAWRIGGQIAVLAGGRIAHQTRVPAEQTQNGSGLDRLRRTYDALSVSPR